jgi:copper chaperone NosL
MAIFGFPGPKGEAFTGSHIGNNKPPMKFCSTGDMLAYLLQPEVKSHIHTAWVHDMGATGWDNPADNAFIDARQAWYVINHPIDGAMGATLASFREKTAAIRFAEKYQARVIRYDEITLDLLKHLR